MLHLLILIHSSLPGPRVLPPHGIKVLHHGALPPLRFKKKILDGKATDGDGIRRTGRGADDVLFPVQVEEESD